MKIKKYAAVTLCAVMALSMTACSSSGSSAATEAAETDAATEAAVTEAADTEAAAEEGTVDTSDVVLTIFNSKSESQAAFDEMAERYTAETGVKVEVYYSSDTVAAHMATKYAAGDPYVLSMVDPKDVYSLGADHAEDLSDQDWVNDTTSAITVDGKVCGFPLCIEARGLIYNADAIEAITGETFDPSQYTTLDQFQALLDQLIAGGMTTPVGIQKEDWSLGAHYLAQVYEEHEDVESFVNELYAGTCDLSADAAFNSLMNTFDVLKANNYAKDAATAAVREDTEMYLAEGDIAFMFGGNWDWDVITSFVDDQDANMGIMAVPQNDSTYNDQLVGGASKYFFIDNSVSDAEKQAARDFLNWLVYDEEGNAFITEDCALIPAFSNIDASALNPLSQSVKSYVDAGKICPNYNYLPDDHYSKLGANMQEYLDGNIDRSTLVTDIQDYWASTTPVEH